MATQVKRSINQAHLENCTLEQIVTYLERELELNGLEAPDELQLNIVGQCATKKPEKLIPKCHYCKKPVHYIKQRPQLINQKEQAADTKTISGNNNSAPTNSNSNPSNSNHTNNKQDDRKFGNLHLHCETCRKTNYSTGTC